MDFAEKVALQKLCYYSVPTCVCVCVCVHINNNYIFDEIPIHGIFIAAAVAASQNADLQNGREIKINSGERKTSSVDRNNKGEKLDFVVDWFALLLDRIDDDDVE